MQIFQKNPSPLEDPIASQGQRIKQWSLCLLVTQAHL